MTRGSGGNVWPLLLAVLGVVLVGASPAWAEHGPYIAWETGLSVPSQAQAFAVERNSGGGPKTFGSVDYEVGRIDGGALGYRISDVRIELNVSNRSMEIEKYTRDLPDDPLDPDSILVFRNPGEISALATMANLYWDFPTEGRIRPYIGAGIGAARVEFPGNPVQTRLAGNALGGVGFWVTDAFVINLGYRWLGVSDPRVFIPELEDRRLEPPGNFALTMTFHEVLFSLRFQF